MLTKTYLINVPIVLILLVTAFTSMPVHAKVVMAGNEVQAGDGELDASFGTGGIVTTDFGNDFDFGSSVVLQPDGKIVVIGWSVLDDGSSSDFVLARYMPDGSLDPTFDSDGRVTTNFARMDDGYAVALQADGRILLAGTIDMSLFALVRYNSDGSLDTTFDNDGIVTTALGLNDWGYAYAVAVQPDEKIVLAGQGGSNTDSDFALVRYNSDGSLDAGFGVNGIVTTDFGTHAVANAIVIQPTDGKIIVAGESGNTENKSITLARYNSNGSLDTTFDSDGKVVNSLGINDVAEDLALQPDGKILAAGSGTNSDGGQDFVLVRYNSDGSLDATFGMDGRVLTDFDSREWGRAVVVQPDGRILMTGAGNDRTTIALARYQSNGTLDASFGVNGKVITSVPDTIVGFDLVLQPDHKIIVVGGWRTGSKSDFMVARYINHSVPRTLYVKEGAKGAGNGTSWTDAYADLQSALAVADNGDEIWVAAGTYKPTADTDRARAFVLERSVALYGGFAGTETSLTQRDPSANVTVLSGDIGAADDIRDNSYHVVVNYAIDGGALLDGFTITLGNANDPDSESQGGGIRNGGTLSVRDSIVTDNSSGSGGGGIHNIGVLEITDSVISNNSSSIGGGLFNEFDASLHILNGTFSNNSAQQSGGGIHNNGSLDISKSVISGNAAANLGGGIYSSGPLHISDSVVSGNVGAFGGGIICYDDSNIVHSTISDNTATEGGGIYNVKMMNIDNSVISGNSATHGGGIISHVGKLNIANSTISDNSAIGGGGGILAQEPAINITGSTFAGNSAGGGGAVYISYGGEFDSLNNTFFDNSAEMGGGILNVASTLNLTNNTFSDNSANTGGGVYNEGTLHYINSILANSISGEDCYNAAYSGGVIGLNVNNLVETNDDSPFVCGLPGLSGDPKLGVLSSNSGLTQTMALLPGSPAINAGSDVNCPPADQRGVGRPQGLHCDIGAYEFVPVAPVILTVTKTADTNDGICNADCSLREALVNSYSGDTIQFAVNGTIVLTSDLPVINKAILVDGKGKTVKLDGNKKYRIFTINETGGLTLRNLTLQNGHPASCTLDIDQPCGGAIYNNGSLSASNVTFSGNYAGLGGAIFVDLGTAQIESSTFTGNSAAKAGGGIFNWIGTLDVLNSTFYGNSAAWDGGAVYNDISSLTLQNNTFSNNSAERGGAVYNSAGDLAFANNILANSTAGGDCFNESPYAGISLNINNLIEANAVAPNNCGTPALSADPKLASLANNGGTTQTMALLSGSPAIDAGDDASCPSTDQRGVKRPYGSHCDMGAYERNGGSLPTKPTFADVPTTHPYWQDIEILYANGLTAGCATNPLRYCPDQIMNRGQAAVFILRANFGSSYVPPVPAHIFQDDWAKGPWAEPWAEGMRNKGLSAGCLANPLKYCPWDQIPREQAVIFALRMKYGTLYTPPSATGTVFADMTDPGYYATSWAEQAYKDGLIQSCGISSGKPLFCPKNLVSRGLAAYMIVRARNLTMP